MKGRILVTGGLGYIGSHTIVELLKNNYEVICIDNLCNSSEDVIAKIEQIAHKNFVFISEDLTNEHGITSALAKYDTIDGIIHFAAYKAVGESVKNPLKYYKNNLNTLINVLEVAQKFRANVVFSSSCTVYGEPSILPISEDAPLAKATSPYGNTKKIGEEILMDFKNTCDFKITSLRYFNPVGAHHSGLLGECPTDVPQNLFPILTQTAIGKIQNLTIHGDDYDTPDGTCIRDFVHVEDLAVAHINAVEYMDTSSLKYSVFNLGSGNGFSVKEVIERFIELTGVKLNYVVGPRRDGDIVKIWASAKLAKSVLGWEPKLLLDEMILSAWNWEQQNFNKNDENRK